MAMGTEYRTTKRKMAELTEKIIEMHTTKKHTKKCKIITLLAKGFVTVS